MINFWARKCHGLCNFRSLVNVSKINYRYLQRRPTNWTHTGHSHSDLKTFSFSISNPEKMKNVL